MTENLRLLTEDGVSDRLGLACDEVLALRTGEGRSLPTLRLYTYRSHAALVGRFQNAGHELHLDACRSLGVPVNRRPTGGGAIIMGEQQLGIALCVPGQGFAAVGGTMAGYGRARSLMANFSKGVVRGLETYGIQGVFARKNDLEVGGRKIAWLGIHRTATGGLLFHCSLLVDLDIPFMLQVLNTPFEKISDKQIRSVSARITTVRRELGEQVALAGVREAVAEGFAGAFGAQLSPGRLDEDEQRDVQALVQSKYSRDEWIFQQARVSDSDGFARVKSPYGLISARVTTAGEQLKAVYLEGDFFCSDQALAAVEGSLCWHSTSPERIRATLVEVYGRFGEDLGALPMESLQRVIGAALRNAARSETAPTGPYGCFVSPGGRHVRHAAG